MAPILAFVVLVFIKVFGRKVSLQLSRGRGRVTSELRRLDVSAIKGTGATTIVGSVETFAADARLGTTRATGALSVKTCSVVGGGEAAAASITASPPTSIATCLIYPPMG